MSGPGGLGGAALAAALVWAGFWLLVAVAFGLAALNAAVQFAMLGI